MSRFIETKVRYDKYLDNGKVKKVTESFLVDALSFTEAEARTIEEATQFISGEFSVSAVKKSNISEIFYGNPNKFYKVKFVIISFDERTNSEKKTNSTALVQALNLLDAYECFEKEMRGTISDYEVISISETAILDILTAKNEE